MVKKSPLGFPCLLQQFFTQRLIQQLNASQRTVVAYRDAFRLLLAFAGQRLRKRPADLTLEDLNASLTLDFLKYLEKERHNCIRSRNARLAAIRSFMEFAASQEPSALALAKSVRAIPMKRFEQPLVDFLTREHMQAVLVAPDQRTRTGRRDRVMLTTLYNTGARVSELTGMRRADLTLGPAASIKIHGKGRKERSVPLWPSTAKQLKSWLQENTGATDQPLFPSRFGGPLTRVGVTDRLKLAIRIAAKQYPELAKKRVSPHVARHSIAMHMLQAGVDITVIALWLGHESPATTHRYVEADLAMKERALKSVRSPRTTFKRYRPTDRVLEFLQSL